MSAAEDEYKELYKALVASGQAVFCLASVSDAAAKRFPHASVRAFGSDSIKRSRSISEK